MELARTAFDRRDWFSAHYYAQKANLLDPRRTDALRIAADASQKLAEEAHPQGEQGGQLYEQKGKPTCFSPAGNYLQAYYSFLKLAALYPKDKDIATYLDRAEEEVGEVLFLSGRSQAGGAAPRGPRGSSSSTT